MMSLRDLLKIRKVADNLNFTRLFYLKSTSEQLSEYGVDLIDCVLAIFLFELTRVYSSGIPVCNKEQFHYKLMRFFFKKRKFKEEKGDKRRTLAESDDEEETEVPKSSGGCGNCLLKGGQDKKFRNLYKETIEGIFARLD